MNTGSEVVWSPRWAHDDGYTGPKGEGWDGAVLSTHR